MYFSLWGNCILLNFQFLCAFLSAATDLCYTFDFMYFAVWGDYTLLYFQFVWWGDCTFLSFYFFYVPCSLRRLHFVILSVLYNLVWGVCTLRRLHFVILTILWTLLSEAIAFLYFKFLCTLLLEGDCTLLYFQLLCTLLSEVIALWYNFKSIVLCSLSQLHCVILSVLCTLLSEATALFRLSVLSYYALWGECTLLFF